MVFEPPLELFSVERKGRPSCRTAFSSFVCRCATNRRRIFFPGDFLSAPDARGSAVFMFQSRRSEPLESFASAKFLLRLMQAARRASRLCRVCILEILSKPASQPDLAIARHWGERGNGRIHWEATPCVSGR